MERRKFLKLVPIAAAMLFMPRNLLAVSDKQMEIEKGVFKSILDDNEQLDRMLIGQPSFQYQPHRTIMNAVERLYIRKEPVDLVTIAHELKLNGDLSKIGGCEYLASMII